MILVGGGAKYSGARDELVAISEAYNIPLVETQAGKSTVEQEILRTTLAEWASQVHLRQTKRPAKLI